MSGFLNFFGKIFGNKYEKDVKEITPIVNEINLIYKELNNISNDELREISNELRDIIQDKIKEEKNTIKKLKEKSKEKNLETKEKESIYLEIDSLEKIILEKIKETLSVILPKAFAVIKETAKRLWIIYLSFTIILFFILFAEGMTFFDAVNHAMTTMATGGFSTKNESIGYFDSPTIQYTIIFFV